MSRRKQNRSSQRGWNAIGAARLGGLEEELGLKGYQFQEPSNLFLNKIGLLGLYLSGCTVVWGVLCTCSAAQNCAGLPVSLSSRLRRSSILLRLPHNIERLARSERIASLNWHLPRGSMLSGAFSGLVTAAITDCMDSVRGLLARRWISIIETSRSTPKKRIGSPHPRNTYSPASNCSFSEPQTRILVVFVYGAASVIAINSIFLIVVASISKNCIETVLLTSPPNLLVCIICILVSWHADRTNERYWHTTTPPATSLTGFIIIYTGFHMSMVWTANTIYCPPEKRAVAAFNNAVGTVCSISGSYLYPNDTRPRFVLVFSVNTGMALMAIAASTVLRFVLVRENRKLENPLKTSDL
ncbi:hypothetical protein K469DRAFT_766242 [Zopfia rhizophila CBS 207.26]|uniref:MFS general substrate transporter n=1 Tax=Zopfia rhizophila CBS 207.26 TaxID=1314779 RepID=A0A6A6ECS1_9PEZI|nr:hypothetical protein K469DRAFT_766242 [Zopfia rhizophila CBS 207.26]